MSAPNPQLDREAYDLVMKYGNVDQASKTSGIAKSTLYARYQRAIKAGPIPASQNAKLETEETENSVFYNSVSPNIKTLEDLIAHAEIDTTIWRATKVLTNKWEMGAKIGKPGEEMLVVKPLWQVKAWFERIVAKDVTDAIDNLFARMSTYKTPKSPTVKKTKSENPHLLEISLFDHHFGKLGWGPETGDNYDLKLAEVVYQNAINDLLNRSVGYNIEQILLPIGQDFFHVNNWSQTTAHGTPQDHDGRFQKVFETGCMAVINAIYRCLETAPVELLWVPGNHDPETSWYLMSMVAAWFKDSPNVIVDKSPKFRKYKQYGVNLIGFTHGNEEQHRDLPALMACEVPDLWAKTNTRTWHLGHYHKRKQMVFNHHDSFNGVTVTVLPSLCGTDAWHYRKGYVNSQRAAEAYLWSRDEGYVGHFNANVRDEIQ